MFGLGNRKQIEVRCAMTRLINQTLDYASLASSEEPPELKDRSESRLVRTLPVFLIPCTGDDENGGPDIQIGFTADVSCFGVSVLLSDTLNLQELVLMIGDPKHRKVMRGTCRYRKPLGMGTCQYGIRLDEVLNDSDYAPLLKYAAALESKAQQVIAGNPNAASQNVVAKK
ncbi:hypothetical protein CA51_00900 [Rosistilla oblonga]|nr:hypothetical protein CA51_00900 [Rosistilla oblonga]